MEKDILKSPKQKICLLDYPLGVLEKILSDEEVSTILVDSDDSKPLAHIDELINLHEAPMTGYMLNDKAIQAVRDEWTVEIPVEAYEKILLLGS